MDKNIKIPFVILSQYVATEYISIFNLIFGAPKFNASFTIREYGLETMMYLQLRPSSI